MQKEMELQQAVYQLMELQLKFGAYKFGDSLPTIKQCSSYFFISVDTVRHVYLRLKQEGFITLSTCVGATVVAEFTKEEIEENINAYFSRWRTALLDMGQSIPMLFCYAQWLSLKNSSLDVLEEIENTYLIQKNFSPYFMSRNLLLIYGALGNSMLTRLIWQVFLFYYAPFLSVPEKTGYLENLPNPVFHMMGLCRKKDWKGLWNAVEAYQESIKTNMLNFYHKNICVSHSQEPMDFTWNIHKNTSQICYSLGTKILRQVRQGIYPVETFLPSPAELASANHVSVNTVRRTLVLLNKIGAAQSVNGVGTKIVSPFTDPKNVDLTDPAIRNLLLNFAESIQILTFSAKMCARATIASMDSHSLSQWLEALDTTFRNGQFEILLYDCVEYISLYAPYQSIRNVYEKLLPQFFWGYALQNLHGDRQAINAFYLPYLNYFRDCLRSRDACGFSEKLENMLISELTDTINYLVLLGIKEAASIAVPPPFKPFV